MNAQIQHPHFAVNETQHPEPRVEYQMPGLQQATDRAYGMPDCAGQKNAIERASGTANWAGLKHAIERASGMPNWAGQKNAIELG